jgi:Lar family restriction alleviation protein
MSEIRDCPCCGGKAEFVNTVPRARTVIAIGYITCKKCGLRSRVNSRGRVLKAWNRREHEKAAMENVVPHE